MEKTEKQPELTVVEQEVLRWFRLLDEQDRQSVLRLLEALNQVPR